jgi:hypothetical protein
LTLWYPLAAANSPSPRDLKRFLNRLRFEVMSTISAFPQSENRESHIVALAALHEYSSKMTVENIHTIFGRALDQRDSWAATDPDDGLDLLGSRMLVFTAAEQHLACFKRGPDADEYQAYTAFVGTGPSPDGE